MISFDGHFRNFLKEWRANEQNETLSSCMCSDVLDDCIYGNFAIIHTVFAYIYYIILLLIKFSFLYFSKDVLF